MKSDEMNIDELIEYVQAWFSRIYLGGIPSLLNDDGAFLSFICCLTGLEALGGFLRPKANTGERFKAFVGEYMEDPFPSQTENLWKLRNAIVHAFSPRPCVLTHHNSHLHLSESENGVVLNAEDFYAALVAASNKYFKHVHRDPKLQKAFQNRADDPDAGVLFVSPIEKL